MRVLVTTSPFGLTNKDPITMLQEKFTEIGYNPYGEVLTKSQHYELIKQYKPEIIIAGTESYDRDTIEYAHTYGLRLIARVGIGVDAVNLKHCSKFGIMVTNTPDAPSGAVADLTICQIINMLRKMQDVSNMMKCDKWNRYIGREVCECTIGIIGCGRIGTMVIERLLPFKPIRILINDIDSNKSIPLEDEDTRIKVDTCENIYKYCDVISLHIPLREKQIDNLNFISTPELSKMKDNVRLLNLSRGGIIDEEALFKWLEVKRKATVALDSYVSESYHGKLLNLSNVYLTPHLGSCTVKSRLHMEGGAVKEAILFANKQEPNNRVI